MKNKIIFTLVILIMFFSMSTIVAADFGEIIQNGLTQALGISKTILDSLSPATNKENFGIFIKVCFAVIAGIVINLAAEQIPLFKGQKRLKMTLSILIPLIAVIFMPLDLAKFFGFAWAGSVIILMFLATIGFWVYFVMKILPADMPYMWLARIGLIYMAFWFTDVFDDQFTNMATDMGADTIWEQFKAKIGVASPAEKEVQAAIDQDKWNCLKRSGHKWENGRCVSPP